MRNTLGRASIFLLLTVALLALVHLYTAMVSSLPSVNFDRAEQAELEHYDYTSPRAPPLTQKQIKTIMENDPREFPPFSPNSNRYFGWYTSAQHNVGICAIPKGKLEAYP